MKQDARAAYFAGKKHEAKVSRPTKDGKGTETVMIKIGPHISIKKAFAYAQSHFNRLGWKVRNVVCTAPVDKPKAEAVAA